MVLFAHDTSLIFKINRRGTNVVEVNNALLQVQNRFSTDMDTARLVYFSYFHSTISYGILLWGRAAEIKSMFIRQKKTIRAIYNLSRRDSPRELFKEINIMIVSCQY